jgi:hypothetical protein
MLMIAGFTSVAAAQQSPVIVQGAITSNSREALHGGPLDGLGYGDVADPAGHKFKGLLPSSPDASLIDATDRAAVTAFIEGHNDGIRSPLKPFLASEVKFTSCKRRGQPCTEGDHSITFGEPCTANTPYKMTDGTIRIEWLYGSALYYISWLTLRNGKIMAVKTGPAWAPVIKPAPTERGP